MTAFASLGTAALGAAALGSFGGSIELLGTERLLWFLRHGPNLRALGGTISAEAQRFVDTVQSVVNAFELDTATGDRLDKIGTRLVLARNGLSDDDYRLALQIQVLLVLPSNGSAATLLEICDTFLGAANVTSYTEHYPMSFRIGITATNEDAEIVRRLVERARCGGYGYSLVITQPGATGLVLDSVVSPLAEATELDSVVTPLAGAGTLAGVLTG